MNIHAICAALLSLCFWSSNVLAQRSTPIQLLHPSGAAADQFGQAVAIDGDTMIVGVPFDDVGSNTNQGSARIYRWTGSGWAFEATLTATGGAALDRFGISVALSGDTALVGANLDDVGANIDQGSAYVFTRSGTTWTQQAQLTGSGGAAGDQFGMSVALSGDTAIVGANLDDIGAIADQGSAYVFTRTGTSWTQQARLNATDGAASDNFGISVALSGDTAIVGASFDNVGANFDQGSAYVFTRTGTSWTQQARLNATDSAAGDNFGISVALSGDTAIVGANFDNVGANADQGSAYVFTRSGTTWTQQEWLTAPDGAANDNFGISVALSGDTALVGAYFDDIGANADQGSAYVFTRVGTTWTQQVKLTAPDGAEQGNRFGVSVGLSGDTALVGASIDEVSGNTSQGSAWVFSRLGSTWILDLQVLAADGGALDRFGCSVAIDGDTAIVGAYFDDVGGNADQGSAYIFTRNPGGTTWTQQAQLIASNGAVSDQFGISVALSGDTAIVGAFQDDVGGNIDQGSAYIFTRSGTTWTQQARLDATDGTVGDRFGMAVALSGDTAIVAAPFDEVGVSGNFNQGSAYVFTRSGTTWTQQARLNATNGTAGDFFGKSVAISGNTALVAAFFDNVGGNISQGSAYIFTRSGTTWAQQAQLTATNGAADDYFGDSVALSGDTAIVGASHDDVGGRIDQGSAYIFTRSGTTWTQQARLNATDGAAGDQFGISVALSGDTAIVGAFVDAVGANIEQGSAYVFTRDPGGTNWTERARLNATDGAASDLFGYSVALSGDTALVGARNNRVGTNTDQGSASMFELPADDFTVARDDVNEISYPTLADALLAAVSGYQITATPAAWRLASTVNTIGSNDLLSTSDLRMPSTASLTLNGSSTLASLAGEPIELYGTLNLPGSGTRIFNASRLTLGTQATLTAGANARMQMASGHFDVAINSNTRFDLSLAALQFRNVAAAQTMEVMSTDIGPDVAGLDRTMAGHHPIGTISIGSPTSNVTLALVDNHDNDNLGQGACEAIYVDELRINVGSRLINTSCRIYYNTLSNNGMVDVPANLIPIAPACPADFNHDNAVDFFDYLDFVDAFSSGDPTADFNGDTAIDFFDYLDFVDAFSVGCD